MELHERNRKIGYTATLDDEDAQAIKAIGKGNFSAGVRKLLERFNEQANGDSPNREADNGSVQVQAE